MSAAPQPAHSAIRLQVGPRDFSGRTISELWAMLHPQWQAAVEAGRLKHSRLVEYRTVAGRWAEFWSLVEAPDIQSGASQPPASQLQPEQLDDFLDWAGRTYGIGGRSQDKYRAVLSGIVRHATRRRIKLPTVDSRDPGSAPQAVWLSPRAIARLYTACESAEWPSGLPHPAAVYWRAAIVCWVHYGFRTQELISYSGRKKPLTWGCICWDPGFPAVGAAKRNTHGWLRYTPEKQNGRSASKSRPLIFPMTESVASHLRAIRPPGTVDLSARVFPWPLTHTQFRRQWAAITAAAGLTHHAGVKKLLPKHLRSNCGTWHDRLRDGMGGIVLGHAARSVTERHYIQTAPKLIRHFARFAGVLPDVMRDAASSSQLRLF